MDIREDIKKLARVIAEASVKDEKGEDVNFGIIDRIANSNSIDLFMFYLREAIRLYRSKKYNNIEKGLDDSVMRLYNYLKNKSLKEFRETVSLLTALSLTYKK